jgi:hypothetical protein
MIDLIVIFVLPPGIVGWGVADILGAEGAVWSTACSGFSSSSAGCLSYLSWGYLHRPVQEDE